MAEHPPELRASDRDRDSVLDLLASAASDGRLTLDEYSGRADVALQARTHDELATLTADLQSLPAAQPAPAVVQMRAVLGSDQRRGRWRLPEQLGVRAMLGSCELDLREAALSAHTTRIDVSAVLGSVTIIVPDGVDVRISGSAVLGSKTTKLRALPVHGSPVIEVQGDVLLGSLNVRSQR